MNVSPRFLRSGLLTACTLLAGSLLASSASAASQVPEPSPDPGVPSTSVSQPRVLLVGMDGLQLSELQQISAPNFDRLLVRAAYTGGVDGEASEQATYSGPGWSTILTGVWADKHHITANDSDLANPDFPSVFKRLRDARPEAKIASVMNWGTPNTSYFRNEVGGNDITLSGLSDSAVTSKGVELVNADYDFVFLHLDEADHVGHASCFGSAYDTALRGLDAQLGQLLDAVEQSSSDWLVLVTTDHGREPVTGCNHGNQTAQEKSIFIASNRTLNSEFGEVVNDISNNDFSGIYGRPAQTAITPTVLRYLGVEPQISWKLDGLPLVAGEGVRKLLPGGGSNDFSWFADASAPVAIYRNGSLLTQVDAMQRGFADSADARGIIDYVLVQNDTPVALHLTRVDIDAAVDWSLSRAYFFRNDGRYVRYNKTSDQADSGYPANTTNSSWPGLGDYAGLITAAFSKDSSRSYYFLSDGRYIRYNNSSDQADAGYPKAIDDSTWPGLGAYATSIRAALRWTSDKVFFFLADGTYVRYDLGDDKVDAGYPKPVNDSTWPGLGAYAQDITAAVKWSDSRAYIFLTNQRYIRYSISNDSADAGYPARINGGTWPGVMNP
ncbi:hemopexin repeat-containing protein [Thalassolituus sp. LLYu03]|uniref:hemopexin repeat-containing protein n=1 Tax=Thalassolituus sp. LLYu03 TaxID=3421656 RepID=UPI003D2AA0AA